ncbi:MAG: AmmeMemoRadiSam system protein B [Candidatus Eisenbacteria bacterium]|nr:AmmeMemoRadiSam system protein B [Candidatus Eisenbacteria bacterium]
MSDHASLIRETAVAGLFYPSDPNELRETILGYLDGAETEPPAGAVVGLIAPHAGYVYSGPTAGRAYAAVRGRSYRRVVVMAPSHRAVFDGASVWPEGAYRTPLGDAPVDGEGARLLVERGDGLVRALPEVHREEHALEVQIPFLQVALGSFSLVPLILGDRDLEFAKRLAALLADCFGAEDTLYVASSDLSHFHAYDDAVRIDRMLLELVRSGETERLAAALDHGETEACGAGPILTLARASAERFGARPRLLGYANSGDTAGGRREVVGYASFAFVREEER